MKFKLLLMAAACIGMVACSKDDAATPSADGSKQIVLKVNLPTTRAALTPDAPYEADGTSIESMNVFFTNANGIVQYAYKLEEEDIEKISDKVDPSPGLRFVGLENVTAVYIVANAPASVSLPGLGANMNTFSVELAKQAPSMGQNEMVFAGCDLDITPLTPDVNTPEIPTYDNGNKWNEGDQTYNADITIRPLISRIEWGKIETDTDGDKLVKVGEEYYLVEWSGWKAEVCGIYQSNVYGAESIFAAKPVPVDEEDDDIFFATPKGLNAIVEGEWATPSPTFIGWDAMKPVLTYNGYDNNADKYASVLPADYNAKVDQNPGQCVPFHFFVPFDVDGENPAVGTLDGAKEPHWHFLLHFEDPSAYNSSIKVYESDVNKTKGPQIDLNSNDSALSVASQFMFPVTTDGTAYVNVIDLFEGTSDKNVSYAPGKIYTTNVTLSPFNVTAGPVVVTDYNVIVKVTVADFATQAVTPEFDKN